MAESPHPLVRLSLPCMPWATCSGFSGHKAWMHYTPSTLWLQPTQGLDYPLSQSFAASAWEGGTLGSKGKVLCEPSRGRCRAGHFPLLCRDKHNTGISLVSRVLPSQPGHKNLAFILRGWTQGTSTDRPTCCCKITTPSHLLPHRRKGGTKYDFNV